MPKMASAEVFGVSPVQASETAYVSCWGTSRTSALRPTRPTESMTSETIGPWTVRRIGSSTSFPPATLMVSVVVSSGTCCPSRR